MTFEEIVGKKLTHKTLEKDCYRLDTSDYYINEKCSKCNSTMSFHYEHFPFRDYGGQYSPNPLRVYLGRCVRCKEIHFALFVGETQATSVLFLPDTDVIMSSFEEYDCFLSAQQMTNLKNAEKSFKMGLYAAAFLYIRRVLESLVFQILSDNGIPFSKSEKFKELIEKAESIIPLFPKDFSDVKGTLYRYLSEGVHSMSDEECSEQFPLAEYAIKRILEHYKQSKEEEKLNNQLRKAIGKINNEKRS